MATQAPFVDTAGTITFDEFLEAYDGVHAEWVDGKAYVMNPGNEPQSVLTTFLASTLQYWVDTHDLGQVYSPPFSVKVSETRAREPDLFFVRRENLDRVHHTYVEGPVDLVIEILSPESRGRDRGDKYVDYEEAGVREYWLIDPAKERVESYRLGAKGYELVALGDPAVLRSEVLAGVSYPVEWLWRKPLPKLPWVYDQWGLR